MKTPTVAKLAKDYNLKEGTVRDVMRAVGLKPNETGDRVTTTRKSLLLLNKTLRQMNGTWTDSMEDTYQKVAKNIKDNSEIIS